MNILWILGSQFFLLSLIAFGGASATLPEMHRIFVDSLHLMSNAEFVNLYALSQAAPGPNVLFVGLFGLQMAGLSGALISLLAMCGPTVMISIGIEHFGKKFYDSKKYIVLRRGLTPICIGFLMSTSIVLMRSSSDFRSIILSFISICILLKRKLNPLLLIIAGGIFGAFHLID